MAYNDPDNCRHLLAANEFYRNAMFLEALSLYNKSLKSAPNESPSIAMIYALRSAVYFHMGMPKLCLDNITFAEDALYPKEQLDEVRAKEMTTPPPCQEINPWEYFKLSYPANRSIPFIVDCLELSQDEEFGRKIVTKRALKPGDIIAIEEMTIKSTNDVELEACQYCFDINNLSLLRDEATENTWEPDADVVGNINDPGGNFFNIEVVNSYYCSKECKDKAWQVYTTSASNTDSMQRSFYTALHLCGGDYQKLERVLDDPNFASKSVFDFDWTSDLSEAQLNYQSLIAIMGLARSTAVDFNPTDYSRTIATIEGDEKRRIALKFMERFVGISKLNAIGMEHFGFDAENPRDSLDLFALRFSGRGILLFGSLFNHSCDHNIHRMAVGNKVVFIANRPISEGKQLFVSYGPFFAANSRDERQEYLRNYYGFDCKCRACENDLQMLYASQLVAIRQSIMQLSPVIDKKAKLRENFARLMRIPSEPDSEEDQFELLLRIYQNIYLLSSLTGNHFANFFSRDERL